MKCRAGPSDSGSHDHYFHEPTTFPIPPVDASPVCIIMMARNRLNAGWRLFSPMTQDHANAEFKRSKALSATGRSLLLERVVLRPEEGLDTADSLLLKK